MTKPQILLLIAALTMIGVGLYYIATEEYSLGAVFSGVGAAFASIAASLGALAKQKENDDAG